jgi:Transposase
VTKNAWMRGWFCKRISLEVTRQGHPVVLRTVWKVLKAVGYSCYKLIVKPGLNKKIIEVRRDFCKKYKYWTLKD